MSTPPPASAQVYALPENRLRAVARGERPQERLEKFGAGALSDTELLAMLLRSGTRGHDVLTLASRLVAEAGSLAGLIAWKEADFKKLKGIGRVKALQLVTVMEIARRVLSQGAPREPEIETIAHVIDIVRPLAHGLKVEKFWALCLSPRNRLIKCVEVASGTAANVLAHPREIFREAIRESASSVICAHNHPTGDPSPSAADIAVTRQLRDAGKAVQIPLLDHIILGSVAADPLGLGYYSFREGGLV